MSKAKKATRAFSDSLDWSRFKGAKAGIPFQGLATDLLFAELGEDGFTPPPTHGGPDGGWDGLFQGRIAGFKGRWKIASAVRAEFARLRAKAGEENQKAQRDRADALLLLTPLDPNNRDCEDLEDVLGKGLKKGRLWPRATLEYLLERYPWVAAKHFGIPYCRGFLPIDQRQFGDRPAQADLPLVGRDEALAEIEAFLGSDDNVLLLVGVGGSGKSRLLREVPSLPKRRKRRLRAWMRYPGCGSINEELRPVLRPDGGAVICLDDAGLALDEVRELVRLTDSQQRLDLKLVLACRAADQPLLDRVCRDLQARTRVIHLGELSAKAARSIVAQEAPFISDEIAERLIRHFGKNLYLLRAAAAAIAQGTSPAKLVEDEGLRGMLSDRLVHDAAALLAKSEAEAERLLLACALDSPLSRDEVAKNADISTLVEGEILQRIGMGVRFRQDVEGDLLLAHYSSMPRGKALITALVNERTATIHDVLRNLAAAGQGHPSTLITNIMRGWIGRIEMTTMRERREMLPTLSRCASVAPDEVIEICSALLSTTPAPASGGLDYYLGRPDFTTDDFGPIIIAIARGGRVRDALQLVLALNQYQVREGMYANYKFEALAAEAVHPAYQTIERVHEALSVVDEWLGQERDVAAKAAILGSVLAPLLARSVSWDVSDSTKITMYERSLAPTVEVVGLRRNAIELLIRALGHPNAIVRLRAAEVASRFDWHHGRANTSAMDETVRNEIAALLPAVEKRLVEEADAQIADRLAVGLLERWAARRAGSEEAGRILQRWTCPTIVSAFAYAARPWEWQPSISDVIVSAPDGEARWTWWVHRRSDDRATPEHVQKLVQDLERVCETVAFADVIAQLAPARSVSMLLEAWCATNPTRFLDADAADIPVTAAASQLIRDCAHRHRLRQDPRLVLDEMRPLVRDGAATAIRALLQKMPVLSVDLLLDLARQLVEHGDAVVRTMGLELIARLRLDDPKPLFDLVRTAARDGVLGPGWHEVWSLIHRDEIRPLALKDSELVRTLLARASDAIRAADPASPMDEWSLNECITILTDGDPERRLQLLDDVMCDAMLWGSSELLKPLMTDVKRVGMFAEACVRWLRDGKLRGTGAVAKLCAEALDRTQPPADSIAIGFALAGDTDPNRRAVGVALLSEFRTSAEACARLVEIAASPQDPLHDDVMSLLGSFTRPRGAWSSSVGEPPPAFVALKDMLDRAFGLCGTAPARALVERMRRSVEKSIESHLQYDEELSVQR